MRVPLTALATPSDDDFRTRNKKINRRAVLTLNDRARRNINPKVFTISTVTVVSLTMPAAPSLKLATPLEGSQIPQL
jgi:hypothetical protein